MSFDDLWQPEHLVRSILLRLHLAEQRDREAATGRLSKITARDTAAVARLTADPVFIPKPWFWRTNGGVLMVEMWGLGNVIVGHLRPGVLLATTVVALLVAVVASRIIQGQPHRWAWRVSVGIQATVAAALVGLALVRPVVLWYLVVPAVGLGALASQPARRYYFLGSVESPPSPDIAT